jgi:putative membrane protein
MSEPVVEGFSSPRRQHGLGVILFFGKNVIQFVKASWSLLFVAVVVENILPYLALASVVLGGILLVVSTLQFLRFRFHLTAHSLVVERGVLTRERLDIPFDRIQTVHLHQNVIQRLFGLTGLQVDTAGSSGSELQLLALHRAEASLLREMLLGKAEEFNAESASIEAPSPEGSEAMSRPLVELGWNQLFKVGLSQNHLRNGLIAFGGVVSFFGQFEEWVGSALQGVSDAVWVVLGVFSLLLIVPGFLLFCFLSVSISVVGAIVRYYGLVARLVDKGLHVEYGLLKRVEFAVPSGKIQLAEWRSNWIRRKMGFETLLVMQAKANAESMGGMKIFIPAMEAQATGHVEKNWYADLFSGAEKVTMRPVRYHRYLLGFFAAIPGWLPFLALGGSWFALVFALVWTVFSCWTTGKRHHSISLEITGDVAVIHRGWFWRRRTVLRLHQLQRVSLNQHLLHARRGIAHVSLHSAAGVRAIRFLPEAEAKRLVDMALYRIESHQGSWM